MIHLGNCYARVRGFSKAHAMRVILLAQIQNRFVVFSRAQSSGRATSVENEGFSGSLKSTLERGSVFTKEDSIFMDSHENPRKV